MGDGDQQRPDHAELTACSNALPFWMITQCLPLELADWSVLGDAVSVQTFTQPACSEAALVERLRDFDVIVSMRERTRFSREVLPRLAQPLMGQSLGLIGLGQIGQPLFF